MALYWRYGACMHMAGTPVLMLCFHLRFLLRFLFLFLRAAE
jgi:hypothetical protein